MFSGSIEYAGNIQWTSPWPAEPENNWGERRVKGQTRS